MMTDRTLMDDCFLHDRGRLRHNDAVLLLKERLHGVAETETVALYEALGRVLAEDVIAPRPVPAFVNAAVDGYAFAHASLSEGETETPLRVVMRCAAGDQARQSLKMGQAARIFTGAAMPDGADSCVMQEDVKRCGETVLVPCGVRLGANTRAAGEDVSAGAVVAGSGQRLRPQDLAAIASTGMGEVTCFRPLRVALLSTGNEVIRPGARHRPGQVYDANHYMLWGLLSSFGARISDFGIVPDDRAAVRKMLAEAASSHDVILTSGGVSRGDADLLVETVEALGSVTFWQLAVKPGRPMAFGQMDGCVFLGLPGNPVAVFVCFLLYALPALSRLQGQDWRQPRRYTLPSGFAMPVKKPGRREFLRGSVVQGPQGPVLQKFARDGSALISGLTGSEGLIELDEALTQVEIGQPLPFTPYSAFGVLA